MANNPLHRFHMAETPKLETFLHVHELLAHVIFRPAVRSMLIDMLEHRQQALVSLVRLSHVTGEQVSRYAMAAAREITQEFVVQARRFEYVAQAGFSRRIVSEYLEHLRVLVAEQELDLP